MSIRCHPSRLVLNLRFEHRLLGVPIRREVEELPFEILDAHFDHKGGLARLRLDRDGSREHRGLLRPILASLISRAAGDLLDQRSPLDRLDEASEVVSREGDVLTIDLGRYQPYIELMNRDLRILGGRTLFPFRALSVHRVQVKEGRLVVHLEFNRDLLLPQDDFEDFQDKRGRVPVQIV